MGFNTRAVSPARLFNDVHIVSNKYQIWSYRPTNMITHDFVRKGFRLRAELTAMRRKHVDKSRLIRKVAVSTYLGGQNPTEHELYGQMKLLLMRMSSYYLHNN